MDRGPAVAAIRALAFTLAVGAAAATVAATDVPSGVHSRHVVDVGHAPAAPARGEDVEVRVRLDPQPALREVILTYCRAENYACAAPQRMEAAGDETYRARIVWDARFFAQAENVGYKFTIHHANGTKEGSPLSHWPYRPPALPDPAGIYYWYPLPPVPAGEAPAPGLGASLLAVGAVVVALGAGRMRRSRQ